MSYNETPTVAKVRRLLSDQPKVASLLVRLPHVKPVDVVVQLLVLTQTKRPLFCLFVRHDGEAVFLEHSSTVRFAQPWGPEFDLLSSLRRLTEGPEFARKIAKPFVAHMESMGLLN
jgi:hypothetical protein